jgi:P27 family predicted phage terminase small subunit
VGEANPPDFLLGYAADEWFRVVDELLRLKLVTIIDLHVLAAYCQAYSRWRTMEEKLAEMAQRDTATAALLIRGPNDAVSRKCRAERGRYNDEICGRAWHDANRASAARRRATPGQESPSSKAGEARRSKPQRR